MLLRTAPKPAAEAQLEDEQQGKSVAHEGQHGSEDDRDDADAAGLVDFEGQSSAANAKASNASTG